MLLPETGRADTRPWHARLHDLMPFRVREILLVSSNYDAFILEEDGPLGERLFTRYSELNLSWSPRITHVTNGLKAMELLDRRYFDMVIAMPRLEDTNVSTLGRMVKRQEPDLPVVVLSFSEAELNNYPGGIDSSVIDRCFLWTGDTRILITICKLIEDKKNIEHDTQLVGVPVILVVEDSVRHYSMFLTELFSEMMLQAQSLVAEGVNNLHKLLRMRTRPKVVHARSYEEAMAHYEALQEHIFALVSDVRFSRNGKTEPEAGLHLVKTIRRDRPELPVLLQSAERDCAPHCMELGVPWVDKNSPRLLRQVREFVSESLGFGDFVFRLPDRTIVGQARDMHQMGQVLKTVPAESLIYHAQQNDFSVWFKARGMFGIAGRVHAATMADFDGVEEARSFLIDLVRHAQAQEQEGLITDFTSRQISPDSVFVRLGQGSIGGKARGIAFANSVLANEDLLDRFDGLRIRIPKTVVIGTEEFDKFVESNGINDALPKLTDDQAVLERFLAGKLSREFKRDLKVVWEDLHGPVAVRSSGLLEDLQFQPFSGVYSTYMLPNNHPDKATRFDELCRAIKGVYASTFSENARTYISNTPFRPEEEKMAITIQEMVGQEHHGRFYPHISGVALSYNFYPIEGQKAEDGTALVALGLGQLIVAGGAVLRFCPTSPGVLPQFKDAAAVVRLTQKEFYALDMTRPTYDFEAGPTSSLDLHALAAAEEDGTLAAVGSVYSPQDDAIRDNLRLPGPRVVTFNNILKWQSIPLTEAITEVLRLLRRDMGCAVEVELAIDMGDHGRQVSGRARRDPTLFILQIRPLATQFTQQQIDLDDFPADHMLCQTRRSLGHGVITDIHDVVYVKRDALDAHATSEVALQVGKVNKNLQEGHLPFMLIGPGRWGSSDPRLGIPVEWKQISGARIIAETKLKGREVEPSQGTHFFQNITSLGVGYLTITSLERDNDNGFIDYDWLEAQPAATDTPAVRHVHLDEPLRVYLDGRRGTATILKPGPLGDPLAPPDLEGEDAANSLVP